MIDRTGELTIPLSKKKQLDVLLKQVYRLMFAHDEADCTVDEIFDCACVDASTVRAIVQVAFSIMRELAEKQLARTELFDQLSLSLDKAGEEEGCLSWEAFIEIRRGAMEGMNAEQRHAWQKNRRWILNDDNETITWRDGPRND